MTNMHEFFTQSDEENAENKYATIRRNVSELIVQQQQECWKIAEYTNTQCGMLKEHLEALKEELHGKTSQQEEQTSYTGPNFIEDEESLLQQEETLENLQKAMDEYQESIDQLNAFMNDVNSLDAECETLLKKLADCPDDAIKFVLQDIADALCVDQHQLILNAHEEMQPGTRSTQHILDGLLPMVQTFSANTTLRDCDIALAYGSLVEQNVSRLEIEAYKAKTNALLTELVDYAKDSQRIVHPVDIIASKAEAYNLAFSEAEIDHYENSSMKDLYEIYVESSIQLQERLQKATTYSEVETLEAHAINQLQNIVFANDAVNTHLYGEEGKIIGNGLVDTGLLGRIFSDTAREDNPYEMALAQAAGESSEFKKLHTRGHAMMEAIEREHEARNQLQNGR